MADLNSRILGAAVVAFISTTVDDFAVMIIFFGKASANPVILNNGGYVKVAIGQTLGFTIVVVISLIGLGINAAVPPGYVGLIGFIPMVLGLWGLYELIMDKCFGDEKKVESNLKDIANDVEYGPASEKEHSSDSSSPFSRDSKIYVATSDIPSADLTTEAFDPSKNYESMPVIKKLEEVEEKDTKEEGLVEEEGESNMLSRFIQSACAGVLDRFTLEVTSYAVACSSDNIAIYIALFASTTPANVGIIILIFYVLLVVNVFLALGLMKCPGVASAFEEYSEYFVPFLLMGLGIYILNGTVIWPEE